MMNQDKGSSLSPVFGVHWLNHIPSLLQHKIKTILSPVCRVHWFNRPLLHRSKLDYSKLSLTSYISFLIARIYCKKNQQIKVHHQNPGIINFTVQCKGKHRGAPKSYSTEKLPK